MVRLLLLAGGLSIALKLFTLLNEWTMNAGSVLISQPSAAAGAYWQWRDQSIYYVKAGDSQRPPILLVHGFGASTDHWRKNIADLQQDFEVWAIDLLGFGRSAKPQWQYSGDLWRDQLQSFINEVIGRPTVVAGNSIGGYATLCVAAEGQESVAGAIILNCAGPFTSAQPVPEPSPLQQAWRKTTKAVMLSPAVSFVLFQYLRRPNVIRKTLKKVYLNQEAVTDQLVEDIHRPSRDRGAAQVFAAVFKSPQGEKVDRLLERMNCPLLAIWGEGDPWMNVEERKTNFQKHYSNLMQRGLEAGHCPHDEVPDQVNAVIREWMQANQLVPIA